MTIDQQTREEPKKVLQEMEVHDQWVGHFRSAENEPFYDLAFDFIARQFGSDTAQPVVDAGCGTGVKSMHLARRGYKVIGLDISDSILTQAAAAATKAGLQKNIEFRRADLTDIDLPSQTASRMICWGVLMHVPAIEKAVAELSRLIAPGGTLIVSEGNVWSLQATTLRALKRVFGRKSTEMVATPAGIEFWEDTASGRFMTRQANIPWLIREFERNGLQLEKRHAGQFSEIFTMLPWQPLRRAVHHFNNIWFKAIDLPGPAFGNLLVLRKPVATAK